MAKKSIAVYIQEAGSHPSVQGPSCAPEKQKSKHLYPKSLQLTQNPHSEEMVLWHFQNFKKPCLEATLDIVSVHRFHHTSAVLQIQEDSQSNKRVEENFQP